MSRIYLLRATSNSIIVMTNNITLDALERTFVHDRPEDSFRLARCLIALLATVDFEENTPDNKIMHGHTLVLLLIDILTEQAEIQTSKNKNRK